MGKIVITGASGRYGRLVTDGLIAQGRGQDLILMTRKPERLADRIAAGCTVRYGDFDRPDTLGAAVAGACRLLLISGTRVGARVGQHAAVIDAAAAAGVRHIVYTSFIGIDDPANPAEVRHDHAATEALIRASGLGFTMLRDAHYADAMVVMAGPAMIASGQWLSNAGAGREAMVWREDCAACAVAVLAGGDAHIGQTYHITGPDLQSFADVAAIIAEVTGRPLAYVPIDDAQQYAIFDAMGIPRRPVDDQYVGAIPWNSDDMVSFGAAIREGFLCLCTDDVRKLTGKQARSVRALIEAHADMLRGAAQVSA